MRLAHNLTAGKRVQLLAMYSKLPVDSRGQRIGVNALETEFDVARDYISHHLLPKALNCPDAGMRDLPRCGRPPVLTDADGADLANLTAAVGGDITYREIAYEMKQVFNLDFCWKTWYNYMKHTGWNMCYHRRTKPMLSPKNRAARAAFASTHEDETWHDVVDVDEKYFQTVKLNLEIKLPPGSDEPLPQRVKHTSFIPQVMFLAAVGREWTDPTDGDSTDGKVGIWRVAEERTAKRSSKNRERGETVEEDITMTADVYYRMMTTRVIPAVHCAYKGKQHVKIQQDGASSHTGKHVLDRLNAFCAHFTLPTISVYTQPPNSPDLNICDLSFFRAMATCVHKRRRVGSSVFNKDELVEDVSQAFNEYPPAQIEKMFEYKMWVMKKVAEVAGDNVYPGHRKHRSRKAS
jgi:hypothetical protein